MKKIVGLMLFIFALCALNVWLSCSLIGSDDEETTGIDAPSLLISSGTITVTSAPIKDSSFLAAVQYANVFRRSADDDKGANASAWVCIGQVECASESKTLTAFSFYDYYVSPSKYYSYCIRYYNGENYYYSNTSVYAANTAGIGEQLPVSDENTTVTLRYYRNDKTGEYTLQYYSPDPLAEIDTDFDALALILSNGSKAKPFILASGTKLTSYTDTNGDEYKQVAATDTLVETHKVLPSSFLDVVLSPVGLILVREHTDEAEELKFYYWTSPRTVSVESWQVDENGDDSVGSSAAWETVTSFIVPSVPEPSNGFDATPLASVSARTARASRLATSGVTLDATPFGR